MAKAPGKSHREGITVMQMADMFPTDEAAREWFEAKMWPNGRVCPHCGSTETSVPAGPGLQGLGGGVRFCMWTGWGLPGCRERLTPLHST